MRKYLWGCLLLLCTQNSVSAALHVNTEQWDRDLSHLREQSHIKEVGSATFTFLFWDIYSSKLFTTSGVFPLQSENDKLLYEIEYFKAISAKNLVDKTVEQWQHLGYEASRYTPYLNKLQRIWPDIKPGDKLTFVMNNMNSAFYYNKRLVGVIGNMEFGPLFLDIWLSEKTSEPELRQALLGRK